MQVSLHSISRHSALQLRSAAIQLNLLRYTSKIAVEVDQSVHDQLNQNELKPRQHPGIVKNNHIVLPTQLSDTLKRIVGDYPVKKLLRDSRLLNQYITSRHPPPEPEDVENKTRNIVEEINSQMPLERLAALSEEDATRWQRKREQLLNKRLAQRTYAWKPITYGAYEAVVYAIGRGAQEYAVLQRIMRELAARDTSFKPRSYFDFGSGIGTGMWVASELWKDSIFEYYNVDCSRFMNELSELILRDGHENKQIPLKEVYFRQFLPALDTKYDLVLASHTLFELPSRQNRKEVLLNLWRKCDGYLIIVEEGTRRGSELVNEARQYLLRRKEVELQGHTFAPCPHDMKCPRLADIADRTPCNFELSYAPLRIGDVTADRIGARYSYVILKKGNVSDTTRNWPRIVRPTLVRSKHAICRMCTEAGKLQEVIFTQSKHGKAAYKCAKVSRWGDRLPITVGEPFPKDKTESVELTQSIETDTATLTEPQQPPNIVESNLNVSKQI